MESSSYIKALENLPARDFIRIAKQIVCKHPDRLDIALLDWLEAISDGELTDDLLVILRDEARLVDSDEMLIVLRAIEKQMSEVVADGFALQEFIRCEIWRQSENRQRKSEILLLSLLSSFSLAISATDKE